jgi:hypothetical protein
MQQDKIIYQLTVEDIQTVANDYLERDLTDTEIMSIEDTIAENIPWYEAIEGAIRDEIERHSGRFSGNLYPTITNYIVI